MLMSRPQGAVQNMSDAMFEEAAECALCDKKFHAFRRKHRCRTCGSAVCGSCARSHKVLPSATIMRYNNEPVRVCDRCVRDQNAMLLERRRAEDVERARARQLAIVEEEQRMRAAEQMRRDQEQAEQLARHKSRREMLLRQLEEKHLGPRPDRVRRSRSLDDGARASRRALSTSERVQGLQDAQKRALALFAHPVAAADEMKPPPTAAAMASSLTPAATTVVQEAEECALCLEPMDVGNAIYTTECGHSFHWMCLKEMQSSDTSNYDKCPSCRATMTEMQVKKHCDHPRVRIGHRFCRDCGSAVSERDAKPRPPEAANGFGGLAPAPPPPPPLNQPVSYRASSHGALVRCPQCHIQMRVLPHMYNMRVACPSGHMFLVQVAGQQQSALGGSGRGYTYGQAPGVGGSLNGARQPSRGMNMGYPGSSYYRATNTYSDL